ncbi:hypothetical protein M427DRAFT_50849 [Gonapodya prolifera JEL478]|uniref:Uncharacterized protein n=1 Tax=Gonapodya prolifera (strain JEL478) TaxID=1344416 RepID=A0A139B0S9_GONPJ|nr:hypothetical protein M427DRAFT_50849 [Gonapodya prolifera JEL478]|eukprot:KXS22550.1 hypothetical protein M427DRAFT_50849 [Gonapodya prolifera JEL478]
MSTSPPAPCPSNPTPSTAPNDSRALMYRSFALLTRSTAAFTFIFHRAPIATSTRFPPTTSASTRPRSMSRKHSRTALHTHSPTPPPLPASTPSSFRAPAPPPAPNSRFSSARSFSVSSSSTSSSGSAFPISKPTSCPSKGHGNTLQTTLTRIGACARQLSSIPSMARSAQRESSGG